jgi:fucose 4-O-acetylase-like acetyltransferase
MEKRQDIEALRTISVFCIVWFHANITGHDLAYSGLIIFLILSMYLAGRQSASFEASIRKRFTRLLVPWMIWFAIYGIVNISKGKPPVEFNNGILAGILAGPSIHLWYLPYMFLALISFDGLRGHISGRNLATACAILTGIAFGCVPYWRQTSIELGYPWAQYIHALPGLLLGIFFLYYRELQPYMAKSLVLMILILACARISYEGMGTPYAVGILAGYLIANHTLTQNSPLFLAALGRYAFGIYLIHILFLRIIGKLDILSGPLVPIAAFLLSLTAIAAISKVFPRAARYVY